MIVNSLQALDECVLELNSAFDEHKWAYVKIQTGSRTLKQNAWINKAYAMLADKRNKGDMTIVEYRRYCKFALGLPILFKDDPENAQIWRKMFSGLSYEDKLKSMDMMPVTSLFSPEQGAEYIEAIIIEYQGRRLPSKDWK